MRSCSRKKVIGERSLCEPIVRGEPGGGSGRFIYYRDIHLSFFGRKRHPVCGRMHKLSIHRSSILLR